MRFAPATWAQLRLIEGFHTVEETLESAKHATISPVIGDPVDDERFTEFFTFTPKDRIGRRYGISRD